MGFDSLSSASICCFKFLCVYPCPCKMAWRQRWPVVRRVPSQASRRYDAETQKCSTRQGHKGRAMSPHCFQARVLNLRLAGGLRLAHGVGETCLETILPRESDFIFALVALGYLAHVILDAVPQLLHLGPEIYAARWFSPYVLDQIASRCASSRYCPRNLMITSLFKASATGASATSCCMTVLIRSRRAFASAVAARARMSWLLTSARS